MMKDKKVKKMLAVFNKAIAPLVKILKEERKNLNFKKGS